MSLRSPLRICLLATAIWLAAMASVFAQDAPDITLKLNASDLEVLSRALDKLPIGIGGFY